MTILAIHTGPHPRLRELAEACFRLSPEIAIQNEGLAIDLTRVSRIHHIQKVPDKIRALCRRMSTELDPRFAFARDIATATALAHYQLNNVNDLPIEALRDFSAPFSHGSSDRQWEQQLAQTDALITTLKRLGIDSIADFAKLPSAHLTHRFGRHALTLHHRVLHGDSRPWPLFTPPEELSEFRLFEEHDGVRSIEPLAFVLKPLLDLLCMRLFARGERVRTFCLELDLERYQHLQSHQHQRRFQYGMSIAQGSSTSLLKIIKERLARDLSEHPLDAPVVFLKIVAQDRVRSQSLQRHFFDHSESTESETHDLVERLRAKVGNENVFWAKAIESIIPESAWQRVSCSQFTQSIAIPLPERPLRLLKEPLRLERIQDRLRFRKRELKIICQSEPERLSGHWWSDFFSRDYFQITVHTGERLWVFAREDSPEYFLHGLFD